VAKTMNKSHTAYTGWPKK